MPVCRATDILSVGSPWATDGFKCGGLYHDYSGVIDYSFRVEPWKSDGESGERLLCADFGVAVGDFCS